MKTLYYKLVSRLSLALIRLATRVLCRSERNYYYATRKLAALDLHHINRRLSKRS